MQKLDQSNWRPMAVETGFDNRRSFMAHAARSMLGVSLAGGWGSRALQPLACAAENTAVAGKAKSVIYLYMQGAMSHLDSFDPKPGTQGQGETQAAQTRVPGVAISDKLPKLAYLMNGIALVRSMTTETERMSKAAIFCGRATNR